MLETTRTAAQRAFAATGSFHSSPLISSDLVSFSFFLLAEAKSGLSAKDMNVAEVHDCFTIAEVLMYEALGFAPEGQGTSLLASGAVHLDGSIPVNTGISDFLLKIPFFVSSNKWARWRSHRIWTSWYISFIHLFFLLLSKYLSYSSLIR